MPLYEYRCTQCNHKFEVSHHVGGSAGPCPVCGGPVKRIISSVGVIFKGSGFHTTDYRRPSSDGAGSESAEKSTTTSTTKSPEKSSGKSAEGTPKSGQKRDKKS